MKLLIVGAGGLGRELFTWIINDRNKLPNNIQVKGFLDDQLHALDNYDYPVKILGNIRDYQPQADEQLVMAIMHPTTKKNIVQNLQQKGAKFFTFIHSSATIGHNVKIGEGCVILAHCNLPCDLILGDFVMFGLGVYAGHDSSIADYTSINANTNIAGNVQIGQECLIGLGATIIPAKHIGNNAIIGAGSTVVNDVATDTTAVGNPARVIATKKK